MLAAVAGVADPIKPGTPAAIAALQAQGLRVVMITGDNKATAAKIAAELGDHRCGGRGVARWQGRRDQGACATHGQVAFVGDGINDAPALAAADVGIAIGTGTDVAIETADVVLMSGDLGGVVSAFTISRATMRNIRQNLFWAFGYNIVLIPVAAGVLYPAVRPAAVTRARRRGHGPVECLCSDQRPAPAPCAGQLEEPSDEHL